MNQLNSFMVLAINGGFRISYIYDKISDETGELVSTNNRGNFYAVDLELKKSIESIREYIIKNKLQNN